MTAAENKKLVSDAFDAWSRGDGRPFFKLLADDVRWTVTGSTPVSGTHNSKRDFRQTVKSLAEKFAGDLKVTVRDVIADGDKVAVQWEGHAVGKNGTAYDQTYCWVMRLTDGMVRECIAYLDTELVTRLFDGGRTQ
jgi:uncharacterized protein